MAAEKEAELTEAKDNLQRELDQSLAERTNSEARLGEQRITRGRHFYFYFLMGRKSGT